MNDADCYPGSSVADVYTDTPAGRHYSYRIPDGIDVVPGMRVLVDFAGREITGFVTAVHDIKPDGIDLKEISRRIDDEPIFDERLVRLSEYVSDLYISSTGEAMAKALPSGESSKPGKRIPVPESKPDSIINLTPGQKKIYDSIMSSGKGAHLIFGITGSGKTEIYISAAMDAVAKGMSVIYLVPEIGLSVQIFERLFRVFGEKVILYHSNLTRNQRLSGWKRFYKEKGLVAVGTRSAVFLQCPELGLIIVDEEHDPSYKEQSSPRYSARRIAFHRSLTENACLILGSATPSVETLHAAEKGIIELHRLDERYGESRLPGIEIVRLTKTGETLSAKLKLFTSRAVRNGRQAVYLLNRRGFSPFVLCGDCGAPVECPYCSIGMNYHKNRGMLCHYCGHSSPVPEKCPKCGSASIEKLGSGTQKVEDVISEEFPGFRIFRLDQDSVRKKDTVYDLLKMMDKGDIDILLGTQMISKGFDFQKVTVAGIILADIGLNIPDFRATEKIFSLLMQLSGRTGRGINEGKVIIQTFNEDHMIFSFLKKQDYWGFYREELKIRKTMGYPPFSRLARIVIRGKSERDVMDTAEHFAAELRKTISARSHDITLLGPSPAPLTKIGGNYRYHMILKGRRVKELNLLIKTALESFKPRSVFVEIDIDPADML